MCVAYSASAVANNIVKMEIQQGDVTSDTVYIKLFNEHTPLTVSNFLTYVDGGDFDNLLLHRSVPDFVIQAGFFTYDIDAQDDDTFIACYTCLPVSTVEDYDYPAGLQPVQPGPKINNEGDIGLSNLRGTLAMALAETDPDSADSQWFVNLVDNNDPLDFASGSGGPFTVFGELINDGMTVFDEIALRPVFNKTLDIHLLLGTIPLVNYTADDIFDENLVKITAIERLFSIDVVYDNAGGVIGATKVAEDVDFGILLVGNTYTADITLSNTSAHDLTLTAVASSNNIDLPYNIVSNLSTCELLPTLTAGSDCHIFLEITPDADGVFDDSINIEFTTPANIEFTTPALSYELSIHSEASSIPAAGDISIDPADSIDFGEVILYDISQGTAVNEFIRITNVGNLDLNIFNITLTGPDIADFRFDENCTANNPRERDSLRCVMQIFFEPLSVGNKTATATITSDDLDEPVLQVIITGSGSLDNDGVPTTIEDLGPNNGDGNNDNILDSIQNHVVTVQMSNGDYATYVFDETQSFFYFDFVAPADLVNTPDNIVLNDVYMFRLDDIPLSVFGERAEIGIYLPAGVLPGAYYMYGGTPDNPDPHWYNFEYDGLTGAQLLGNVEVVAQDGSSMERSLIILNFFDGQRGDADLFANGRIVSQGAYTILPANSDSSSSGGLSLYGVLLLFFVTGFFRVNCRSKPTPVS